MPRLKILYYNWTDYDDPEQIGGGVSVYQNNLVEAALRQGDEVWFISSGVSYSPFTRRPFIRRVRSKGPAYKFELVNSAILSPGQAAFGKDVATAPDMEAVFAEFLDRHGPFDVVHFNNLEGIPVSFLRLARQHCPQAKVVFSVHNYFAFCPQVNLWFQEKSCCRDFRDGKKCVNCLVVPPEPFGVRRRYQVAYCLRRLGIRPTSWVGRAVTWLSFGPLRLMYRSAKLALQALRGKPTDITPGVPGTKKPTGKPLVVLEPAVANQFAARRRHFVDALNTYADYVLAVSRRVAELTVEHGIASDKVRTLYIGTRFAQRQAATRQEPAPRPVDPETRLGPEVLRLAYLGYMRRDKGFYFFLDALKKMPARLASQLRLVFATRIWDRGAYDQIRRMAHRFDAVTFYDGYTHAQLPGILAGVDLGVVPVLWEDNLPQVAIECVASGVPVLTADRGGAQELLDCPALVFKAGSIRDFHARLQAVLDDPGLLRAAQANHRRLWTPDEHYECLREEVYLLTRLEHESDPGTRFGRADLRSTAEPIPASGT
jgi:glycosyltransferase involved in cell wall biosynthesis